MSKKHRKRMAAAHSAGGGSTLGPVERPAPQERSLVRLWLARLAILLAVAGVYHNGLSVPFIFDDHGSITNNPYIRRLWPLGDVVKAPYQEAVAGRPVVSVTLALNYAMSGLDVWSYHVTNVFLHLLAGLLFFALARAILSSDRLRDRYGGDALGIALSAALLWAMHPLNTETVNYTIQRTELLAAVFLLLTVYGVVRGAQSAARSRVWYALSVVSCLIGVGCKEILAVAPVLAVLIDWTLLSSSFREMMRRRWGVYAGLGVVECVLAISIAQGHRSNTVGFHLVDMSSSEYARTQFGVIAHYIKLALFPYPLALDYFDWPVALSFSEVLPQALVVLLLLAGTVVLVVKRNGWGVLGAWFFVILAPTSSVVPIISEVAAERRMYLPLMAVVLGLVLGGWNFSRRALPPPRSRWPVVVLVVLLAGVLGGMTVWRNSDYQDQLAIWEDAVRKRPQNARALTSYATALRMAGRTEDALKQLQLAVQLRPAYFAAFDNLGVTLFELNRVDEAIQAWQRYLEVAPDSIDAQCDLARALSVKGRHKEALQLFGVVLAKDPAYTRARDFMALALLQMGRPDEAIAEWRTVVQQAPGMIPARVSLAGALAATGRRAEAQAQYEEALRLEPGNRDAARGLERLRNTGSLPR